MSFFLFMMLSVDASDNENTYHIYRIHSFEQILGFERVNQAVNVSHMNEAILYLHSKLLYKHW